jgi:Tol biopolymer transport system component/DNA-binding winged helix-turn-helix (wHTH) protein
LKCFQVNGIGRELFLNEYHAVTDSAWDIYPGSRLAPFAARGFSPWGERSTLLLGGISIWPDPQSRRIARFGPFEVDLNARELRKFGTRVPLHDQPFQVLAMLLVNPGQLVTREELRRTLWQSGTFVDFENGLNNAVKRLRDALCDSVKQNKYIETVPRRGYRFIAAVSGEQSRNGPEAEIEPSAVPPAVPLSSPPHRRRFAWIAGFCASVAIAGVTAWGPLQRPLAKSAPAQGWKSIPLITFVDGSQWLPAFSPDGSRVAYSWRTRGKWYLEVKAVDSESHLRLTRDPADFPPGPSWSPDGTQLAYARAGENDHRGIFVISALGGPEKKIRSISQWRTPQRIVNWSPDGQSLVFADEIPGHHGNQSRERAANAIFLISLRTLETRQLTFPAAGDFGDSVPTFSPDGETIAFVRTGGDSRDQIYSVPVRGGTPRRLVSQGIWTNGLAWTADGKSIIFDRSIAGGFRLWRVSSDGGAPHPLDVPEPRANLLEPTLWHDRLAYERHEGSESVGRVALNGFGGRSPFVFISSTRSERAARYSPKGNRIAFISNRSGSDELWIAQSDGSDPVQLTIQRTPLAALSWDPTGKSIAVSSASGKVFLVSIESRFSRLIYEGPPVTDENVPNLAFSRRGDSVYVLTEPGTGEKYELLKVPLAGGRPSTVVAGRLTNFDESMDGETLFYSRAGGIWKRAVNGGSEQLVAMASGIWDVGQHGLYIVTNKSVIQRYSFEGRPEEKLARLDQFSVTSPLSISPDEQSALFGCKREQIVEIDMVSGFK